MGLERNGVALLSKMRTDGVTFGRVLTLGRQGIYLEPHEYRRIVSRHTGRSPNDVPVYADALLQALGAGSVDAMDASPFEGATLVHDLNRPVSADWHDRFDLVIDGGTLEHVFNFPIAIGNIIRMLRVGGRFVGLSPTNGWCGHGFYQFSPELFWRTFAPDNGCSIVEMYVAEPDGSCYAVAEPARVRTRVELCTTLPMTLLVHARVDARRDLFTTAPQQSDYVAVWSDAGAPPPPPRARWKTFPIVRNVLQVRRHRRYMKQRSLANRTFFTPVDLSR
jgi:SAM-dependent methyltransferase